MPSSERGLAVVLALPVVAALGWASPARAQTLAEGFRTERLYQSAPGAGWFVMDTLDMHGGLGGAVALTLGYAHDPLRVQTTGGAQHLTVVSAQAFAGVGLAATYDRFRLYLDFDVPFLGLGDSGTVGAYSFRSPCTPSSDGCTPDVTLSNNPDLLSDARIGFDARLVGDATSAFRLGAGAQLYVPNGERAQYVTDGSYRAMGRVLAAGDAGPWTYAAQLGVHVRPLDDAPAPGSPRGSELLFGVAGGARLFVSESHDTALVAGPEIFGATAFRSFLGGDATAVEGMMTARVEGTRDDAPQLRLKLGVGAGLDARFGAPEWRAAVSVELFDHANR